MHKFATFLAAMFLALGTAPAVAEEKDACAALAELAEIAMAQRQAGTPVQDLIDQTVPKVDPRFKDFVRALILGAYETPRYRTPSYQKNAITDFSNQIYLIYAQRE